MEAFVVLPGAAGPAHGEDAETALLSIGLPS
jgi:hypothetical protein